MSNHLTRIEREAEAFADDSDDQYTGNYDGYVAGATSEHARAAPVVKALEDSVVFAKKVQKVVLTLYPELNTPDNELAKQICQMEQIIETYNNDNV